jgi:Bacterial Ig domain
MNNNKPTSLVARFLQGGVLAAAILGAPLTHAATLWTGPNIGFTNVYNVAGSAPGAPDHIVAGVALNRNRGYSLYNSAAGETAINFSTSPLDTMWAFGQLSNYSNLTYVAFTSLRNGNTAANILNKPMVLHLVNENIYIAVTFTAWGMHGNQGSGSGGFAYTRSTAPVAVPPTVSISSPSSGAVFAAPANVLIRANASVTGGSVTNVTFRQGSTVLGSATASPFSITASNLAAGPYSLTAVATAAGLSTTSSVVNITVINPVAVTISSPQLLNNQFIFSYSADPGLTYVLQDSPDLFNWSPVSTNVAATDPVSVTNPLVPIGTLYYRVDRLPNP